MNPCANRSVSTDQRLIDELTNVVYTKPLNGEYLSDANDLQPKLMEQPYSHVIISDREMAYGELEEFLEGLQEQERR